MLTLIPTLLTFQPVSLEEVSSLKSEVKLLDRHDTKFVCQKEVLKPLLQQLSATYDVLEIGEKRIFRYENLYFDTVDLSLYHQHHNQKLNRYKFRYRHYVDSSHHFWEMKFKSNKGKTSKSRSRQPGLITQVPVEATPPVDNLVPALWTRFSRITLVNRPLQERLTIDTEIEFEKMDGKRIKLPKIAVMELKQNRFCLGSPFVTRAKEFNVFPKRFSKYCTGVALLGLSARTNRFKPRLRTLQKLSGGNIECLSQN